MQDYGLIEKTMCVCKRCERLTPQAESRLEDRGFVCYPCAMIASGAVELELSLEVS